MLYEFRDKSGKKNEDFLRYKACGNVEWCNYIREGIKACKTSDYIFTKFPVKLVQILKSDRFCGIIKTELLYTFLNADSLLTGQLPRLMAVGM